MDNPQNTYKLDRYDLSRDRSLRAWSAADEYLLQTYKDLEVKPLQLGIYNDRFGYLTCHLHTHKPTVITHLSSQEKAISANLAANGLEALPYYKPLESLSAKLDLVLLKVPKSLDLFRLLLEDIVKSSTEDVTIICAFMTRHFSPKMIEIAESLFENAQQSRAYKKSRCLTLTSKKASTLKENIITLQHDGHTYKQYPGVFSSNHIDYATQFLLEQLVIDSSTEKILDLGSGNGVIAKVSQQKAPDAEIHLVDDAYLAVASAKLNLSGDNIHHHYTNELSHFEDASFDVIVTNPPFHFEHEINIQVPLFLFKECHRCLKTSGSLQLVANQHLNYKVHLEKIFGEVVIVGENDKFVVYNCKL